MDKETSELIEKIEGAGVSDPELFWEAFRAVHGPKPERVHGGSKEMNDYLAKSNPFFYFVKHGAFVDAALSLVPKGWIVKIRRYFNGDGEYVADVWLTDSFTVGRGCDPEEEVAVSSRIVERKQGVDPTPAAIAAASLKARLHTEGTQP